ERRGAQDKLEELKKIIAEEQIEASRLKESISRQISEEANLKAMNGEIKAELFRVEEKLTSKKNQLNQIDIQNQDVSRKLTTVNFELERSSLRLKDLMAEERAQEL